MADFKVYDQTPGTGSNGQGGEARLSHRQELVAVPWMLQLAIDGKVFVCNQGTASTVTSFGETAYDEDQPQFAVRVPESTTIIPLYLDIYLEDSAGTDTEAVWSYTTNDIGNGTSTAITTVTNALVGGSGTACTARSLYTGNATAATGLQEFARFGYAFADATTHPAKKWSWSVNSGAPLCLKGTATLQCHIVGGTTAPSGFLTAVWAEFDTSELGI